MRIPGVLVGVSALVLGCFGGIGVAGACACEPAPIQQQRHPETRVMAGIQWNFGRSAPELVFGVRRIETRQGDGTIGGKFDIAIPLSVTSFQTPVVRLMALAGNRDVQAEFGFGLKLMEWKPVVALGVQVPYANGGVNYVFGDGLNAYLGINSLARPNAPSKTAPQT